MPFRSVFGGIRSLFRPAKRNAEIEAEVRSFFESAVDHKMRQGMSREDAERTARSEISSAEMVRHKVWAAGWESRAESWWKDAHYGFRQIRRSPGLSIVAILSLALGIGANTAIFTVINDLLLKRLPVRDPQMLVSFGDGSDDGIIASSSPGPYDIFPYDFYRRIAGNTSELDGICAFSSFPTMVSVRSGSAAAGPATQAMSHLVSGTFFSVLGAQPLMGRVFHPDDTAVEGSNAVAVISYRYWQENLSADPAVVGRAITINGTSFAVVGVMPSSFYGVTLNEQPPDLWLPITMQQQVMMQPSLLKPDGLFWIWMMARRRPSVPVAEAQSWATVEFQRFLTQREGAQISPRRQKQISGTYIPLMPAASGLSYVRKEYETPLTVLMIMVGIVLLIACANLANLLLAKAASREREFCARLALGSTRGRIIRQILIEALVLALTGGALGLGLAFWTTRVIIRFIDDGASHTALSATPDVRVLLFTFAICIVTAVLFGIAPALRGSQADVSGALNASARTAAGTSARSNRLLPKVLIIVQVALSLVMLTVSGLLLRTLQNLRGKDLGLDRTHVLLVNTNPKFAGYQPEQLNALYGRILDRMDSLPGVRSSGLSGSPPLHQGTWGSPIDIDGRHTPPNEDISTFLNRVSTGYFETVGIPLLRGRTIQPIDNADAPKSVVVNKTFADRYFANGDAIGHSFTIADPGAPGVWHIVGIVRDSKHESPAEKPMAFAYLATTQLTGDDQYAYWLEIRSAGDPASLAGEVRAGLAAIDPNLPVLKTLTIAEQFEELIDQQTFVSKLAGCFALLALTLACIGLYGVMTYRVVRRTSELGVRMALGAPRAALLWMVLKESILLLVVGIVIGIPVSLAASHAIRSGLFGVEPTDPLTLIAAVLVMSACLLAGSYMPARRAAKIDPMTALRYE
ncbi:MAG TPA: ABC transporter permease [Terracidiphilus sp.]|nr:ABC transporter permease [Terracidiphilus sp.]